MSYLAFTSPQREVHVAGWERHRLPGLVQDLAWGLLGVNPGGNTAERLESLIPDDHYLGKPEYRSMIRGPEFVRWADCYRLALTYDDNDPRAPLIQYQGHTVATWDLMLNTALAVGSGPMKLAARLAGQMGSHVWIDGPDRAFVADLIEEGMITDVFRPEAQFQDRNDPVEPGVQRHKTGWTDVIGLLRENDREPVATFVSTMDEFPNGYLLGVPADAEDEMEVEQIWDIAKIWLRNRHQGWQIKRDGFDAYQFGHRLTVFDLAATDWEARLDRAITDGRI